jgi:hypothetical protein
MLTLHPPRGVIIGVDTHKDTHTAAAVGATGNVVEHLTVSADPAGYRRLVAFGRRHEARLWAIEGTGSFGAGLTTELLARGERIVEVDRPQRPARRGGVKSDDIDAVRAARQALAGVGLSEPRSRGEREAIRVLLATRGQAVECRTRAISALHALVISAPDRIRQRLRALPLGQLLRTCAGLRGSVRHSVEESATVLAIRSTARRAIACEEEAAELEAQLATLVRQIAPPPARPVGNRPCRGRSDHRLLVPSGPCPLRGRLRQAGRCRAHRGVVGDGRPAPTEQIRRPTAQPGTPHDRARPNAPRPGHEGLPSASPRRGQDRPRHQEMPEALYRPTTVPPARSAPPNP